MKKGILLVVCFICVLFVFQNCASTTNMNEPEDMVVNEATEVPVATELVRGQVVLKTIDDEAEKQRLADLKVKEDEAKAKIAAEAKAKREAMARAKKAAELKELAALDALDERNAQATAIANEKLATIEDKDKGKKSKGKKQGMWFLIIMGIILLIIIILILLKDRKKDNDDDDQVSPPSGPSGDMDREKIEKEIDSVEFNDTVKQEIEEEQSGPVVEENASVEPDPNAVPEMKETVGEMAESVESMNVAAEDMKEKILGEKNSLEPEVFQPEEKPAEDSSAIASAEAEEIIIVEPDPPTETKPEIAQAVAAMAEEKPEVTAELQGSSAPGTSHVSPNKVHPSSEGNSFNIYYKPGQDITDYVTLMIDVPEGWAAPSREAGAAGYFTAEVNEGKVISLSDESGIMEVELYGLKSNSEVKITIGDKSGGGPGITVPEKMGEAIFVVKSGVKGTAELAEIDVNPIVEVE